MNKNDLKIFIKIVIAVSLLTLPFFMVVSLIQSLQNFNGFFDLIFNTLKGFIKFVLSVYSILIVALFSIYFIFLELRIFQKAKRKSEEIHTDNLKRDLPNYYPPAIASFLLDLSVEYTDYTATIAYLISKKFINNDFTILNKDSSGLLEHEKYTLDCLSKKTSFNFDNFKEILLNDAQKLGLVKSGKRKVHFFRNISIAFLILIIINIIFNNIKPNTTLHNTFGILLFGSYLLILGVLIYSIYLTNKYLKENYFRTEKGAQEAKYWKEVKTFIHNYTLLKEKNLKDITLFEEYIPYAISLNEAKEIEKYIKTDSQYRTLIYGDANNFFHY